MKKKNEFNLITMQCVKKIYTDIQLYFTKQIF